MRIQNPFAALSTTGIDSQVLVVLARSDNYLSAAQVHALLPEKASLKGVWNSLSRLVSHGTVLERVVGRNSAFALNRQHILAEAILEIAAAKRTLLRRINEKIAQWPVQPLTVELFGSAARNDMSESSDIDLFFVMPSTTSADEIADLVGELATSVNAWTGNDVRPLVYLEEEIQPASIFDSILEDGINIAGNPAWLRKHLQSKACAP